MRQRYEAGVELSRIAETFKKIRPELSQHTALQYAILANPSLGEVYTGFAVDRTRVDEVKNFMQL